MGPINPSFIPPISLILAMLLWGGSFIALKIAFRAYDPMVVMFARMLTASICFAFFFGRFRSITIRKGDLKLFLAMAFFEPCLYFSFEAQAISNTSASQAGMITAMLPLMVALAAWVFLKEDIPLRTVLAFVLAVIGVCLLSISGTSTADAPNPPLGNFFEFLAMASATGYVIILKRLTQRYPALLLTGIQALVGTVYFFLLLFLPGTVLPRHVDMEAIVSIVYLGAVVTLGAYFLYNYSISKMPVSRANAFVNLIPVFTLFLGWLILGETFTPMQFLASGIILFGVFLSQI